MPRSHPSSPFLSPLLTSKATAAQHAATVAAVQALITHVQSPLPMGGCVTPVDHFAVLFLFRLWLRTLDYTTRNKKRKREKKRKPYFHFTAVFMSTWALGRHFLLKDLCCPTGCTSRRDFIRPRGVWSGVPLGCRKVPDLNTEWAPGCPQNAGNLHLRCGVLTSAVMSTRLLPPQLPIGPLRLHL